MLLLIPSCKQAEKNQEEPSAVTPSLPEDFDAFYDTFHSDTSFQLSHIVFPLAEKEDGSFWQASEWEFHNNPLTGEIAVKRDLQAVGGLINELVYDDMGFYVIHRRFIQTKPGEWNLIYYNMTQNMSDWDKVYENSKVDIKPITK